MPNCLPDRAKNYKKCFGTKSRRLDEAKGKLDGTLEAEPFNPILSHHGFVESTCGGNLLGFVPPISMVLLNFDGWLRTSSPEIEPTYLK